MPKQNFTEKLTALLKTHSDFLDDIGKLIPAAVRDHAWRLNHDLIKLLLTDDEVKATFFDEIEGHWVFNHNTFINYITDKNFLANSYTQFRNKIGLNIGGKFLRERGEVSLVWPYKDCVLDGGQTKEAEKRKEIFFNEILAQDEINRMFDPKVLTHYKRHTLEGEQTVTDIQRSENGVIRENLIIKGNNLITLHPEVPEQAVNDFIALEDLEKQKQLLAELLDKNQLYVNLSEIEDADFGVSAEDKTLNRAFYGE